MEENNMTSSDRQALRERFERAHAELFESVEGLSEAELGTVFYGTWSPKDILAHVAAWQEVGAQDLGRVGRGHVPVLSAFNLEEVDEWNTHHMRARATFPAEQVMDELRRQREAFLQGLDALDDGHVAEGEFARALCDVFAEHDSAHAEDIRRWRSSR